MSSGGSLLRAHQGESGSFVRWLEDLGLKDFLVRYPLRQLVEWNWLVPKSRVIFPKEFFVTWTDFPSLGNAELSGFEAQALLWDSYWFVDEKEPLWFLDPFFRPDDVPGNILLEEGARNISIPLPEEFTHPNGWAITPYIDYFFHWQGYALIDVIRTADCIVPILNTPDAQRRAQNMATIVEGIKEWRPEAILTLPNRWSGWSEPMTWLSHYRAFRDALANEQSRFGLQRKGAKELASLLGITAEMLASAIKDKFLVLAQDWLSANKHYCVWTMRTYPHLQRDISIAVEWLCYLTDKTFNDYLEAWQYESHVGQREWAELHKVLEFEFFSDKKHFQRIAPEYLKSYNALFHTEVPLEGAQLKLIIGKLHLGNYPFGSFLGAFRQLHEELSYRSSPNGVIDFRELRPLDHFSLLAIRAEGCLRFFLEQSNSLGELKSLKEYVEYLARRKSVSEAALVQYSKYLKSNTRLHTTPDDPIGAIISLNTGLADKEHFLVQAFLCCELARNYFAHHHYLDQKLVRSREGGFMLTGILVTVLFLIGDDAG